MTSSPHVAAVAAGAAGLTLALRPERELGGLVPLIAPLLLLSAVVAVAQHVVLAIVVLSGLKALSSAEDDDAA